MLVFLLLDGPTPPLGRTYDEQRSDPVTLAGTVAGDHIYIWDFYELETEGGLYLKQDYAEAAGNSHPNASFSATVAPLFAQRVVDVIEGRGDTSSLTGK
jgi:hypothetical protein